MSQNAANVSNAKPTSRGTAFVAPHDTTVPTDATTPLADTFNSLGYLSDDGLTNSIERSFDEIVAFGGDTVMTPQTSYSETFGFTMIEITKAVLEQAFGPENVTVQNGEIVVRHNSAELPQQIYVFEIVLTRNRMLRIVVPLAQVTEIDDIEYVDGEPIGHGLTVSALPDENGDTAIAYFANIVIDGNGDDGDGSEE